MPAEFDLLPGHTGAVGRRQPDGELSTTAETGTAYRAVCSCGWLGATEYPATDVGSWSATSEWAAHVQPFLAATPPHWLLNRSDVLRDNLQELATTWPLQALGVLAEIERWHRPALQQAVDAARAAGKSWAEIGAALGVTRQSAHERFSRR
ncbi:hypothetical protein [Cryptosporangium aurantiacum]|uniref:Homeodomain-like domain-containing protein n=1 Tax=Cryptosporangium aurantiacum TaxID=134849 RepID=A0A1M7QRI9_9ACTN|nr:hypothetical protein [Cryptosporangium aurantiacum]SHN33906.1 hypothetical protein SAMN05443668_105198 [Cryptosporangium aurantiacum]